MGRVYEFAQILDEKHVSIQKHRLKIRLYFLLLNGENYELLLEEGTIQVGKRNKKSLFKSYEKIVTIQKTTQIKQFCMKWTHWICGIQGHLYIVSLRSA